MFNLGWALCIFLIGFLIDYFGICKPFSGLLTMKAFYFPAFGLYYSMLRLLDGLQMLMILFLYFSCVIAILF